MPFLACQNTDGSGICSRSVMVGLPLIVKVLSISQLFPYSHFIDCTEIGPSIMSKIPALVFQSTENNMICNHNYDHYYYTSIMMSYMCNSLLVVFNVQCNVDLMHACIRICTPGRGTVQLKQIKLSVLYHLFEYSISFTQPVYHRLENLNSSENDIIFEQAV